MDSKYWDNWNPMEEDFRNRKVNSYREGVGQDLQNRDISDVGRDVTAASRHKPVVLYVTNVPLDMDEVALQNIFEHEGRVTKVHIPVPSPENAAKYNAKVGFVTMENARGAHMAIENLNGFLIKGRRFTVKVKLSKEELARKKEQNARREEFSQTFVNTDGVAAASSSNAQSSAGSPASPSPHSALKPGILGEAASPNHLSITVQSGSGRKPAEGGRHVELNNGDGAALTARTLGSESGLGNPKPAASVSGSDVGIDQCAHCERIAKMRCRACKKVYYCNAECQRADWPVHRRDCSYESRVPAAPAKPLLPTPDFDNMEVELSDNFVQHSKEYLKEWLSTAEARSDSSFSSGETRRFGKPENSNSKQSSAGKLEGSSYDQKQKNQPLRKGPIEQKLNNQQQKGSQRDMKPQNMDGTTGFTPNRQRNDSQRSFQKNMERRPQNKLGEFQQKNHTGLNQQDQQSGKEQERPSQPASKQHNDQNFQGSGFSRENLDRKEGRSGGFPQNRRGPGQNAGQERTAQSHPRRDGYESAKGGHHLGHGENKDKFPSQRGRQQHGRGGKADHFQPRGEGPHKTEGGPVQSTKGQGQQRNSLMRSGPRQPEDSKGPNSRQNQSARDQHQREDNNGGQRNKGYGYQQKERGYNKKGNNREEIGSKPMTKAGEDSGSWEAPTPKSPRKEMPPLVQNSQATSPSPVVGQSALFELDKPVQVIVSHIDSPHSFWVQLLEQINAVVPALSEILSNYTGKGMPATVARVGEMYLCEFLGELARAQVVSLSGNMARIFFVDYGNSEDTPVTQLLPLPAEMASLPVLGVKCALRVSPSKGNKEWPSEVINLFKELFSENTLCTVTPVAKVNSVTEVTLVRDSDGLDAAAFLIEKEFGIARAEPRSTALTTPQRVMAADMPNVMDQLSAGQHVDVSLLETTGPMNIFVHILSMEKSFAEFSMKMVAEYNSDPETAHMPVKGELVMGRFSEDKNWYRAEVLNVNVEKGEAMLFYIDYGNTEVLSFHEMRAIKPKHAATPIQGFFCAVAGMSAPSGDQWNDTHTATYLSCLQKYMVQGDDSPECTIVVQSFEGRKVWIDIINEKLQQSLSENLSQHLEEMFLPQPIQPQVLDGLTCASQPLPSLSVPGTVSAPSQPCISSNGPSAKLESDVIPFGEQVACGIQDIESCHRFYITQRNAEEKLHNLRDKLNNFCSGLSGGPAEDCKTVSEGDLVLVEFSVDCEWYRGCVEKISDDGTQCTIFFVDFGNREDKLISELKILPSQFLEMPGQAIPCRLAGIPDPASEEVEVKFRKSCLQTEVLIEALSKDGDCYSVDIISADHSSISKYLLNGETPVVMDCAPSPCLMNKENTVPSECLPSEDMTRNTVNLPEEKEVSDQFPCPGLEQGEDEQSATHLTRDCLRVEVDDAKEMENNMVTHVVDPSLFYAVNLDHLMAQVKEGSLVSQLQEFSSKSAPLSCLPKVGDLLSGLFADEWFRCEVIKIVDTQVLVNFIDYGNEALLELTDLRTLPKMLCDDFPVGIFKCSIHGIKPAAGDDWDEEAIQIVKDVLINQGVKLSVKSINGGVRDVAVIKMTGEDVGQILMTSGKAVARMAATTNQSKEDLLRQMDALKAQLAALEATE